MTASFVKIGAVTSVLHLEVSNQLLSAFPTLTVRSRCNSVTAPARNTHLPHRRTARTQNVLKLKNALLNSVQAVRDVLQHALSHSNCFPINLRPKLSNYVCNCNNCRLKSQPAPCSCFYNNAICTSVQHRPINCYAY